MVLQTLRHHIDFAYHESLRGQPASETPVTAVEAPDRSLGYWARKVVVLPIGERWALIAILTALTTPRVVFSVLLIWGVLAAAYTTAGRVQRSLAGNGIRTEEAVNALRAMCDLPLAIKVAAREPLTAKLGWMTPPTIQLVAYVVALGLIVNDALLGAATFALLAAVIYHHYDVVYRIRANAAQPPHWLSVALGGNLRPLGADRGAGHGDRQRARAQRGDLAARGVPGRARGRRVGALLDPARRSGPP